jgi:hypothetical protein
MDLDDSDRLYDEYVKSLERDHWGMYVGVSAEGEVVLGATLVETVHFPFAHFWAVDEIHVRKERG